jgi:K+ transporter
MAGTTSTDIHTTLADEHGHPHTATPRGRYLALLSLTALGIVYGDIGTSPLYAMRECFHGPHAIAATPDNIFGVLSLIFWALIIIISIKYCVFVLRADNHGEGGILALTALATPIKILSKSERTALVVLGIFGAALLYGDGIITPAISVLGAIEGLNVATPLFAPYVVPVTIAIIASQALISGAYSLTMQAIQLGFMPRLRIEHTSSTEMGQIYIPGLNWALMIGCIAIVVGFGSSSNLAAAYGVAVTATMVITTILLSVVEREKWGWSLPLAFGLSGFFLIIDLAFFGANIIKIPHGGWFPLVVGALIFLVMTTWKKGRRILAARLLSRAHPIEDFLLDIAKHPPVRVPGTAVFMNGTATGTPPALMRNIEHNKVLHERVVLLTVKTKQVP